MNVPRTVDDAIGEEEIAARISLGGEDALFVTPTRTLLYRGEGLLSDESVQVYDHDAERIAVSEGRRKSKITLEYPIDDAEELTIPSTHTEDALATILAGVLDAQEVIEDGESVLHTYRFSELTLVITTRQLIKHVGEAVWDTDYETFPYEEITGIDAETGDVSTQIVVEVEGRTARIKTPSDRAREVRQHLEDALRSYHGLESGEPLDAALESEEIETEREDDTTDDVSFGERLEPLSTGDSSAEAEESSADPVVTLDPDPDGGSASSEVVAQEADDDDFEAAGFEPADEATPDLEAELTELRSAVEQQNKLLVQQQQTIEQLIEELRRGR